MVNYIGAYISEEYFYSRDTAVRWILLYHTSVTATLVPSYFIRLDTYSDSLYCYKQHMERCPSYGLLY